MHPRLGGVRGILSRRCHFAPVVKLAAGSIHYCSEILFVQWLSFFDTDVVCYAQEMSQQLVGAGKISLFCWSWDPNSWVKDIYLFLEATFIVKRLSVLATSIK